MNVHVDGHEDVYMLDIFEPAVDNIESASSSTSSSYTEDHSSYRSQISTRQTTPSSGRDISPGPSTSQASRWEHARQDDVDNRGQPQVAKVEPATASAPIESTSASALDINARGYEKKALGATGPDDIIQKPSPTQGSGQQAGPSNVAATDRLAVVERERDLLEMRVKQLEMEMRRLAERVGNLETEREELKVRVVELERGREDPKQLEGEGGGSVGDDKGRDTSPTESWSEKRRGKQREVVSGRTMARHAMRPL